MPTLAQQVVLGNAAGNTPKLNLQGIAVGNGCLGKDVGVCAFNYANDRNTNMPFFAGHGLISPLTYDAVQRDCPVDATSASPACQADFDQASSEIGNVNVCVAACVRVPPCALVHSASRSPLPPFLLPRYDFYGDCKLGAKRDLGRIERATGLRVHTRAPVPFASSGPIACIDETIALYLGRPDVAAALHVLPNLHWAVCGSNSSFDYTRTEQDERLDVYPTVYTAGVRVLIFNGEADACVPWIDNNNWVASMNFTVAQSWTSWESLSQNAGYVTQYTTPSGSHFDFATVKGAGHSAWGAAARCPLLTLRRATSHTPLPLRPHSSLSQWSRSTSPPRRGPCSTPLSTTCPWPKAQQVQ